ncbi:MAG: hypothetical protein IPP76_01420 [Moraxellaceae bacterium]|nr:hypothetical protein [Moraxellaceae bacterium]
MVGQKRYLRKPRLVGQTDVYLSGLRLETGELLIVASNIAVLRQWTFMPYVGRLNIYFSALKVVVLL